MDERESILIKIKKLITLANDRAATEGERDNAMRMTHSLLAKHNLTMAQAESMGSSPVEERKGEIIEIHDITWARQVANAISKLFFCDFFTGEKVKGTSRIQAYFVGKTSNVFTAQEMVKYVITSIKKEASSMQKTMGEGATYWRSFCKGAASRVAERCWEIRNKAEQVKQQPNTCTAIVPISSIYEMEKRANEKFIADSMGIRLKKTNHTQRNTEIRAHAAGRAYGDRLSLNTQLNSRKVSGELA